MFVKERWVPILRGGKPVVHPDGELGRPLRAMTMQGPRVTLAKSEVVEPGCTLTFHVVVLPKGTDKMKMDGDLLKQWLEYGLWNGLGQWRTGSYGRFTAQVEKVA